MPNGNAYMTGIQSFLAGEHNEDVAIVDGATEQRGVIDGTFGDVAKLATIEGFFACSDFGNGRLFTLEHRIKVDMCGHEIDVEGLQRRERFRRRGDLFDKAKRRIVVYPLGEIMQTRGVRYSTLTIAHKAQIVAIVGKGCFAILGAECKCKSGFDKGGAVELTEVDDRSVLLRSRVLAT